jgi:hypothetical protein
MPGKSLQKSVRYFAIGSLLFLIVVIAAANFGVLPERLIPPVAGVAVITFFLSVAAYAGSFVIAATLGAGDFRTTTFYPVSEDVPEDLRQKYAQAERKLMAGGLAVWGGLICIFVFGYLGSLIRGDAGGIAGSVLGIVITLAAITFLGRSWLSAVQAREQAWKRLGRHRWELVAYLAVTVLFAVLVAIGNHAIRSTPGHGASMVLFIVVVVRLRMIWNGLW